MKNWYITSGIGISEYELVSFDSALQEGKIHNYNLQKISSILPKGLVRTEKIDLEEGSPLHCAYAKIHSNNPKECIATAVAVAIPKDKSKIGVIMEHSMCVPCCSLTELENEITKKIECMCREAMKNRGYDVEQVIISSKCARPTSGKYTALVSALAIW